MKALIPSKVLPHSRRKRSLAFWVALRSCDQNPDGRRQREQELWPPKEQGMTQAISLPAVPSSLANSSGRPEFRTYQGGLHAVDLSNLRGPYALPLPLRLLKHKRWQYVMVATPEVLALF